MEYDMCASSCVAYTGPYIDLNACPRCDQPRFFSDTTHAQKHFSTIPSTKASIESITRQDLIDFHKKYFHPGGFILAVSGDFKTSEMILRLEKMFQGWPSLLTSVPPVPKPMHATQPGVYLVNKSEVNQGRVSMGHLGTMRDNPDYYALNVMDDILGGGGFTSRIMWRVRADEGLAYSAGSDYGFGVYYDGIFQASFQSKNPTVAQAVAIVLAMYESARKNGAPIQVQ